MIDSIIKGGASLIGGVLGQGAGFSAANKARSFNRAEAMKNRDFMREQAEAQRSFNSAEAVANRDWQKEMSDTSYQRSMADLEKAGLNPMLAYMQGGASSPAGASAQSGMTGGSAATATPADVAMDVITPAIQTGLKASQQAELLKAQKHKILADTMSKIKDTDIKSRKATQEKLFNRYLKKVDTMLKEIDTNSSRFMDYIDDAWKQKTFDPEPKINNQLK